MPSDLRTFITELEQKQQLVRIKADVDPLLEIAAITNKVCKQPDGGSALLFESPLGSDFRVATNMLGSVSRIKSATGVKNLNEITQKTSTFLNHSEVLGGTLFDRSFSDYSLLSQFSEIISEPNWVCMQNRPDLFKFPFLQNWRLDGSATGFGRYITVGQVFTTSPDGTTKNCGIYRAQICGANKIAIRWNSSSGGAKHLKEYRLIKKPMPVAIALGGDPILLLTAMMPLPPSIEEVKFAGFLRNERLQFSSCKTVPLSVPASAELVLEGFIRGQHFMEGPFGNHTGFYSPQGDSDVMEITKIFYRHDAIIPATVVGAPPMEDCWMAKIWDRVLLAFLKSILPPISDIHIPLAWSFQQSAIISLESPSHDMVREISCELWKLPWFTNSRILVFVEATETPLESIDISWKCINLIETPKGIIFDKSTKRLAVDATGQNRNRIHLTSDFEVNLSIQPILKELGIA